MKAPRTCQRHGLAYVLHTIHDGECPAARTGKKFDCDCEPRRSRLCCACEAEANGARTHRERATRLLRQVAQRTTMERRRAEECRALRAENWRLRRLVASLERRVEEAGRAERFGGSDPADGLSRAERRALAGVSVVELGALAGVDEAVVERWEQGTEVNAASGRAIEGALARATGTRLVVPMPGARGAGGIRDGRTAEDGGCAA